MSCSERCTPTFRLLDAYVGVGLRPHGIQFQKPYGLRRSFRRASRADLPRQRRHSFGDAVHSAGPIERWMRLVRLVLVNVVAASGRGS